MGNLIAALQPKKKFIAGHLLLPFFFFFSSSHKATWSRRMAASCPFWWLFRQPFWPYRPISVAVLAEISSIGSCFCWNRAESGRIDQFRPKSAQIEKKRANQRVRRQTPCRDESSVGAATLEPHQCFPDLEQCLTFNLDIFLFLVCQHT